MADKIIDQLNNLYASMGKISIEDYEKISEVILKLKDKAFNSIDNLHHYITTNNIILYDNIDDILQHMVDNPHKIYIYVKNINKYIIFEDKDSVMKFYNNNSSIYEKGKRQLDLYVELFQIIHPSNVRKILFKLNENDMDLLAQKIDPVLKPSYNASYPTRYVHLSRARYEIYERINKYVEKFFNARMTLLYNDSNKDLWIGILDVMSNNYEHNVHMIELFNDYVGKIDIGLKDILEPLLKT